MSIEDKTANIVNDLAGKAKGAVSDATGAVSTSRGVISWLHKVGMKSEYAYIGAFGSIGLSLTSWFISRKKTGDSKGQSDRWGIFIGHWAPTFMALGVALKLEEE